MASYDSDSSGDEDNDYAQTNVVLGFASHEPAGENDTISHLGGTPEWLDPAAPPSSALAKCKACSNLMPLLLQLNAELPDIFPGHERRLYVLGCRRKACRRKEGSVRVVRGVRATGGRGKEGKKAEKKVGDNKEERPAVDIGGQLFGAKSPSGHGGENPFALGVGSNKANPFSTTNTPTVGASGNPFSAAGPSPSALGAKSPQTPSSPPSDTTNLPQTFASALSLNMPPRKAFGPTPPPEAWPQDASLLPTPYPTYYLEDDIEYLDKLPEPEVSTTAMDLDDAGPSSGGGKEDKEVFESEIDKTFQKFADRLAQNPEQVIRYEFRGQPLLYSKNDAAGKIFAGQSSAQGKVKTVTDRDGGRVPRCGSCGGRRVFEVQLTPHAISELEKGEDGLDGMEWGTVLVGVCEEDCVPDEVRNGEAAYIEEWVGVQWEEVGGKR